MRKKFLTVITIFLGIYLFLVVIFGIFGFFGKTYISEDFNSDHKDDGIIEITLKRADKISKIPLETYLYGVVAAEMPASFENEALKAQAVAARTFTISKQKKSSAEHPDATVCDDINHCKAYISENELKEKYGESWYLEYYPKIKSAVDNTKGIIATYTGEPITAVFHSTSSGITENSKDVWSGDVPYLVSVVSEGEEESPKYHDTMNFTKDDFKTKILQSGKEVIFSDIPEDWIGSVIRNKSGSVNTITIGNTVFKGTEIRTLLGLRSTNFEIAVSDNITVTTKGNGHGVGMSQYGANYMAKQGYTFEQILKKYYTGIEIEKLN